MHTIADTRDQTDAIKKIVECAEELSKTAHSLSGCFDELNEVMALDIPDVILASARGEKVDKAQLLEESKKLLLRQLSLIAAIR